MALLQEGMAEILNPVLGSGSTSLKWKQKGGKGGPPSILSYQTAATFLQRRNVVGYTRLCCAETIHNVLDEPGRELLFCRYSEMK